MGGNVKSMSDNQKDRKVYVVGHKNPETTTKLMVYQSKLTVG